MASFLLLEIHSRRNIQKKAKVTLKRLIFFFSRENVINRKLAALQPSQMLALYSFYLTLDLLYPLPRLNLHNPLLNQLPTLAT